LVEMIYTHLLFTLFRHGKWIPNKLLNDIIKFYAETVNMLAFELTYHVRATIYCVRKMLSKIIEHLLLSSPFYGTYFS